MIGFQKFQPFSGGLIFNQFPKHLPVSHVVPVNNIIVTLGIQGAAGFNPRNAMPVGFPCEIPAAVIQVIRLGKYNRGID